MPVPKKKTSKSKRDMRRAHDFLTAKNFITCSNCALPMLPHKICTSCGWYRGKSIVAIKTTEAP